MGTHIKIELLKLDFLKSDVYFYLSNYKELNVFLLGIETIFRMKTISEDSKNDFFKRIKDDIVYTNFPLEIKQTKDEVLLYPKGCKLLDEKLANDNLD